MSSALRSYNIRDDARVNEIHERPRLPSITNFLQGAGHADANDHAVFINPLGNIGPLQSNMRPPRSASSPSAMHNPWSPQDDMRQKLHVDQRAPLHMRNGSDNRYGSPPYHQYHRHGPLHTPPHLQSTMSPAVVPPPLSTYHEPPRNHYVDPADQESVSPNSRATAKQLIREENVSGRGPCYVYDDGSVCQKVINGDPVNPKWGTTKAGKPRKRLGQACNTCREKKIKCDPSYPKCTQCQKFNRECRFDPTFRSHPKSPKAPKAMMLSPEQSVADELYHHRSSSVTSIEAPTRGGPGHVNARRNDSIDESLGMAAAEQPNGKLVEVLSPPKRAQPDEPPVGYLSPPSKRAGDGSYTTENLPPKEPFSLAVDPFVVNKHVTRMCLDTYFSHAIALKHNMVPQRLFMEWVENHQNKSSPSILVVYAMLAWGSILESTTTRTQYSAVFSDIALDGVMQPADHFSLPLIQARIIFGMHQFQTGQFERAWDLCGAALRAACALRLNTEDGIQARCREGPAVYDLDPSRLAESMRRTFWSIFQLDRWGISCLGYGTPFHKGEICLRLPSLEEAFESGHMTQCPVYDVDEGLVEDVGKESDPSHITLVRRMQISSILSDVLSLGLRSKSQSLVNHAARNAAKRRELEQKLLNWNQLYTSELAKKSAGGATNTEPDYPIIGGLHVTYHHAYMSLHRHIHHAHLTRNEIAEHVRAASYHAYRTLEIAQQLVSHGNQQIYDYHVAVDDPPTAYAILTALDIVTAAGRNSDIVEHGSRLMSLIMPGTELVDRIARRWTSAKYQQELVSERIKYLLSTTHSGVSGGKVAFFITRPMALSLGNENDVIYGIDRLAYLRALGLDDGLSSKSDLVQVRIDRSM